MNSKDVHTYGHTYTTDDFFKHLVDTAIPLYIDFKRKGKLLTMLPQKLLCTTHVATLGTMSELGNNLYKKIDIEQVRLRKEAQDERNGREERGEGDRLS